MIKVTVIDLTPGSPDLLDLWLEQQDLDQSWGDWLELTFDPDV
jgi:hypothetical protein